MGLKEMDGTTFSLRKLMPRKRVREVRGRATVRTLPNPGKLERIMLGMQGLDLAAKGADRENVP